MSQGSSRRFEDGLASGEGGPDGQSLGVDGVDVITSRNAGSYYCAHAFYLMARWSLNALHTSAGFLHVPADPETTGDRGPQQDRHQQTGAVIAAALRGLLDDRSDAELRVLLTGYGAFQGVVDNPTGSFVADDEQLLRAAAIAAGVRATLGAPLADGIAPLKVVHAGRLLVARAVLDVADHALDVEVAGSLPWALQTFAPHVALAMGVHRSSHSYRVELLPTDAGLNTGGPALCHERGAPVRSTLPEQPVLARAIERGARSLRSSRSV